MAQRTVSWKKGFLKGSKGIVNVEFLSSGEAFLKRSLSLDYTEYTFGPVIRKINKELQGFPDL